MSVIIETSKGDIVVDVYVDECPKAATNFLKCVLRMLPLGRLCANCSCLQARHTCTQDCAVGAGCSRPAGLHAEEGMFAALTPPPLPRLPAGCASSSTTTTACSTMCSATSSRRAATPPTPARAASRCGACCTASRCACCGCGLAGPPSCLCAPIGVWVWECTALVGVPAAALLPCSWLPAVKV